VRMYGYSKAEVEGHVLPIIPREKLDELKELMRRVESTGPVLDLETERLQKDGTPFAVQLSLRLFREAGEPTSFLEATLDIRDRVRWRNSMLEIEKLASMGKMAAGTAHHLNSPLAALLLRVELMRERFQDPALTADLMRLEEGLKFCRHFVQRLLEFTRTNPVQKQDLDLGAAVESVAGFFSPVIRAKRASLLVDAQNVAGVQVYADRNLLETVLLTLLSNSLDAVPTGGEIRVQCRSIPPDCVEVAVSDNGGGISPGDLSHVFQPFFTTKEPGKGTGLGLAIAKQLMFEHGGSIRLESELGVGTTARIELPLARIAVPEREVVS
jgi:two-component system NtrC family sensor kinase